jgi:hypothetical protein
VFISFEQGIFLIGGNGYAHNNLHFDMKTIKVKANLPHEKTFFCAVYHREKIYTFGGYDCYLKVQLQSCEYYDLALDKWFNSPVSSQAAGGIEFKLNQERSQASCCVFEDNIIYIFGGYHKDAGTLNSIERFDISQRKIVKLDIVIPSPIRRFASLKISSTKILLIGGLGAHSEELDSVFCFDLEKDLTIEQLDKIDKAGAVDCPILLD